MGADTNAHPERNSKTLLCWLYQPAAVTLPDASAGSTRSAIGETADETAPPGTRVEADAVEDQSPRAAYESELQEPRAEVAFAPAEECRRTCLPFLPQTCDDINPGQQNYHRDFRHTRYRGPSVVRLPDVATSARMGQNVSDLGLTIEDRTGMAFVSEKLKKKL